MSAWIGRRLAVLVVVLAVGGPLAGCATLDPNPDPQPEDPVSVQSRLAARPSLEEALARYEEMQQSIRDQLDAAIGPFLWKVFGEGDVAGCSRTFPGTDGVTRYMPLWGFEGNIPDVAWSRAKQIVTDTVAEYGFETPTLQIDQPGRHVTTGADLELGAVYDFGTNVNTTMQVTTGCHLPEAERAG